jgi:hypothetical protein
MALANLSIYSRYGMLDRMDDGYVVPPNRRAWSMAVLYADWESWGFLNTLRAMGHIEVSYAGGPYVDFALANNNRHQVLALSCFLDSRYAREPFREVLITAPHSSGNGSFIATFSSGNGCVNYTTENGTYVLFRFDSARASQI